MCEIVYIRKVQEWQNWIFKCSYYDDTLHIQRLCVLLLSLVMIIAPFKQPRTQDGNNNNIFLDLELQVHGVIDTTTNRKEKYLLFLQ